MSKSKPKYGYSCCFDPESLKQEKIQRDIQKHINGHLEGSYITASTKRTIDNLIKQTAFLKLITERISMVYGFEKVIKDAPNASEMRAALEEIINLNDRLSYCLQNLDSETSDLVAITCINRDQEKCADLLLVEMPKQLIKINNALKDAINDLESSSTYRKNKNSHIPIELALSIGSILVKFGVTLQTTRYGVWYLLVETFTEAGDTQHYLRQARKHPDFQSVLSGNY